MSERTSETVFEMFLRIRPPIVDLWPIVFKNTLEDGSLIGVEGIGKSLVIIEIMACILTRNDKSKVLFVDVDQHFNILKLVEACKHIMQKKNNDPEGNQNIVEAQLKKLQILTCYEEDFKILGSKLEKILTEDRNISLVIIDSVGQFYYTSPCQTGRLQSKANYVASILKKFKAINKKYDATIVYTKPDFMLVKSPFCDSLNTHYITLNTEYDIFLMKVKHKGIEELHVFRDISNGLDFL